MDKIKFVIKDFAKFCINRYIWFLNFLKFFPKLFQLNSNTVFENIEEQEDKGVAKHKRFLPNTSTHKSSITDITIAKQKGRSHFCFQNILQFFHTHSFVCPNYFFFFVLNVNTTLLKWFQISFCYLIKNVYSL